MVVKGGVWYDVQRGIKRMESWWIVVLSVVIPLLLFMLTLLPWIKSVVKGETKDLGERVARMEGRLEAMEKSMESRLEAMEKSIEKFWKDLIPLYRSLLPGGKPGNPGPRKEELLMKLENDTITWEEAVELQRIMEVEGQRAKEQNDILKAILIVGILALIAAALTKQKG